VDIIVRAITIGRCSSGQELFQSALPEGLAWADGDAIAPAMNLLLLDRDPVEGGRLSDLNLELSAWRHDISPATLPESRHSQSSGFVNGLGGYIDGVADS
jgi:hypothetical protein